MRVAAIAVVFLSGLGASGLLAQRAPAVSPSGFGRMMFPGGGGPPGAYAGAAAAGMYGVASATVLPTPRANNPVPSTPSNRRSRGNNQTAVVPYPVYVGGGYGGYYDPYNAMGQAWPTPGQPGFSSSNYLQSASAPASQAAASSQETSPKVVINQYFQQGTTPANAQAAAPTDPAVTAPQQLSMSAEMQSIFLIAMKDHTIYAANSYWVEDNTLNYITVQGTENSVSMDLVDRDLSRRLNRDRKVSFGLPAN